MCCECNFKQFYIDVVLPSDIYIYYIYIYEYHIYIHIYIYIYIHMFVCVCVCVCDHVTTSCKLQLKQTWPLMKAITNMKLDTEQTMKLE